jgi:hypothetical protein
MKLKTLLHFLRTTTSGIAVVTPENHLNNCSWSPLTTSEIAGGSPSGEAGISSGDAGLRVAPDFSASQTHTAKTALLCTVATPKAGIAAAARQRAWPFIVNTTKEERHE